MKLLCCFCWKSRILLIFLCEKTKKIIYHYLSNNILQNTKCKSIFLVFRKNKSHFQTKNKLYFLCSCSDKKHWIWPKQSGFLCFLFCQITSYPNKVAFYVFALSNNIVSKQGGFLCFCFVKYNFTAHIHTCIFFTSQT